MTRESKEAKKRRLAKMTAILKKKFPNPRTALNYSNPVELLVATILSAQCTDQRVNTVTKDLFKKYKTAEDYANAPQKVFEKEIRSTGFFRNKAKSVRAAGKRLLEDFGGNVPEDMDQLLTLPGVARKTANVVLGDAFGKQEGIVVDTHVSRVAQRLNLTTHNNNQGDKIEKDLMALVPRKDWIVFAHLLILYGRQSCTARKPNCEGCLINSLCPSAFKV